MPDFSRRGPGRWTPIALSLAILALGVVATVAQPAAMTRLRNLTFDSYQRWAPREYRPAAVRVIDIDDESLARLGQWPWPRTLLAELVGRLRAGGAAAIALDVMFPEPDRSSPRVALAPWLAEPGVRELAGRLPDHDTVFAAEIGRGRVVTGFTLTQSGGVAEPPAAPGRFVLAGDAPQQFLPPFRGAVKSLAPLEAAAAGNGALNVIPEGDGVVRRLPLLMRLGDTVYPTLAAEALRVAEGATNYVVKSSGASGESRFGGKTGVVSVRIGGLPVATNAGGEIWLHFSPAVAERSIAAWKILAGEIPREELADAIVFLGTSAAGLKDLRLDPLGRVVAGAEAHAQAVEQILQRSYLTRPDWATAAEILFMLAVWAALVVLILRFGALAAAVVGIAVAAAAFLGSWLAFTQLRLLLDPTFPSLVALAVYLVCSVSRHWQTERDKLWIREAFSSYISPNLVQYLIANPSELGLGGERRECSFVLSDLEAFTSLVEAAEPSVVVGLLNEYLAGMVRVALEHEGTLDRIVGDAVAVMFSAPVVQADHAARAVACARAIDEFAESFRAAKHAAGLAIGRTRVGVNTGVVTIGNVGGEGLIDYRALGDAVNTAARLESVNGILGTRVCVSGATVAACPGFEGRPVGALVLKGKSVAIEAFEPLSRERAASQATRDYLAAFELLRAESPAAEEAFAKLHAAEPGDPLADFHLRRLRAGETGATVVLSRK
ncbi:MAG: adenylate/guanylate cyclase domain-containing protein [Acidobacteriota bacterium]|nr:adenylate/guanylate cyclase domain-containing protein [Acidobacteriota bacterium]MDH3522636.1 adenylate/guanylate cyclase domain-containing protein [Acidobacteriota bacterium]